MSEAEIRFLLARMANDDHSSLKKLYMFFNTVLLKFAYSFVKSNEVAEEIVDDVFIRIWLNRAHATEIVNFKSYLYASVKNRSLNHLSSSYLSDIIQIEEINIEIKDNAPTGEEHLYAEDTLNIIEQAVNALPIQCSNVYQLVKNEGMKYKDVALHLNISVKTVEYHMGNALKSIAKSLAEETFSIHKFKVNKVLPN
ncbi:RNA polymerase sigma-70 factor [Pedobacter rhodius]|uniref:RNA polymerase sigma-70 factor n=1 Tax=Pedobacter rhodius TaxID=3004098 RepID=A0ABT4KX64_9SPHI|nr:RNA polymerase sigma-70 factor [Pedobacter sp. SJ11]MCZ4223360.1 RNA polymerase sigma-70 factor [Pedobacter sp. SJ11]